MTEPPPMPSLADRALQRLRRVASGNGLEPDAIVILEKKEQVFVLEGTTDVSPYTETQVATYPGAPQSKGCKAARSLVALQEDVSQHTQNFAEKTDWLAEVTEEIQAHESQGWGLENARVPVPKRSAVYAATESCPTCGGRQFLTCLQCQGQGTVICTQCQGQGRELCYYCGGHGENPQQPGQPCTTCHGLRYAPCRFCQTQGRLACPTCGGKKGTLCSACQGKGVLTQEVTVTCGAETHFIFKAEGSPSGLRRGLERIGIINLGKGHADITVTPAPPLPKEEKEAEKKTGKTAILNYRVALPYAELRMGLGAKKAIITVVGKRCALIDVPPFLDAPLAPWRDRLKQAAAGHARLEAALEARALRDILGLVVAGKGRVNEARKLYPFGLSSEALTSMIANMKLALNKATFQTRLALAILGVVGNGCLFYALFETDRHWRLIEGASRLRSLGADIAFLAISLAASWGMLTLATRQVLKKRFPQTALSFHQKIGKTGWGMLGAIGFVFLLCLWFAPVRPLWLALLIR